HSRYHRRDTSLRGEHHLRRAAAGTRSRVRKHFRHDDNSGKFSDKIWSNRSSRCVRYEAVQALGCQEREHFHKSVALGPDWTKIRQPTRRCRREETLHLVTVGRHAASRARARSHDRAYHRHAPLPRHHGSHLSSRRLASRNSAENIDVDGQLNLQGTRRVISPSSLLPYIDKGDSEKVSICGKGQTLHEGWDRGILETEEGSAKQIAKRLDEKVTDDDRNAWQSGTPKDWANESIAINTR